MIDRSAFGNASSIFTSSGSAARKFRNSVSTGNVGVNIGVPAPMAYFPFSGWKGSFFGVMHAQGRDAVEFFTDKKVIVGAMAEGMVPEILGCVESMQVTDSAIFKISDNSVSSIGVTRIGAKPSDRTFGRCLSLYAFRFVHSEVTRPLEVRSLAQNQDF